MLKRCKSDSLLFGIGLVVVVVARRYRGERLDR